MSSDAAVERHSYGRIGGAICQPQLISAGSDITSLQRPLRHGLCHSSRLLAIRREDVRPGSLLFLWLLFKENVLWSVHILHAGPVATRRQEVSNGYIPAFARKRPLIDFALLGSAFGCESRDNEPKARRRPVKLARRVGSQKMPILRKRAPFDRPPDPVLAIRMGVCFLIPRKC